MRQYKIFVNKKDATAEEFETLKNLSFSTKKEAEDACLKGITLPSGRVCKYYKCFVVTEEKFNKLNGIIKVYVVTNHYETGESASTTTVVGTFSTLKKAQAEMKKCFDWEKKNNFAEDLKYNECEVEKFDNYCSIYNCDEGDHYVSINITETELQ